jgi:hypothetical protein
MKKLSTQIFTSDFNGYRPFAQILASQNSKGKYESKNILDFVKIIITVFLKFLNVFCCLFQFLIILDVSHYFGIFEIFKFLNFLLFFEIFLVFI